jgi:hypothetical protein
MLCECLGLMLSTQVKQPMTMKIAEVRSLTAHDPAEIMAQGKASPCDEKSRSDSPPRRS